jgi:hypothetical protein
MRTSKMIIAVAAVLMMVGMSAAANAAPWKGHRSGGYVSLQVHIPVPHIYFPAPPAVVSGGGGGYACQPQQYTPPCNNSNYNTGYNNNNYNNNYHDNRYAYNNNCNNQGYRNEHANRYYGNRNHYNRGWLSLIVK